MRLVSNLSDTDNIVRTSQINIDQISESFGNSQTEKSSCHNRLKHGITCVNKKEKAIK
jgi:hypothetical protein